MTHFGIKFLDQILQNKLHLFNSAKILGKFFSMSFLLKLSQLEKIAF